MSKAEIIEPAGISSKISNSGKCRRLNVDLFSNLEYKMFRSSTNDKDEDFSRYNVVDCLTCGFQIGVDERWKSKIALNNKQPILDTKRYKSDTLNFQHKVFK